MKNTLWNNMVNSTNVTTTENGDKAYKTTLNPLLDFMFKAGTLRTSNASEVSALFINAYNYNPVYAIRLAFYIRDVRGGQGERQVFRTCMETLSKLDNEKFNLVFKFIPEYGRWDDLVYLLNTIENSASEDLIFEYLLEQLTQDLTNLKENKSISLLAKWLPSENATAKDTVEKAKKFRKRCNLSSKEYRQALSKLRAKLDIVERKTTANKWDEINYNTVPSNAMLKYRNAFNNHDFDRYSQYLHDVADPTKKNVKINAKTLYPFDIISNLHKASNNLNEIKALDAQWKALPDYFGDKFDNALVVADVSGSMYGTPINVCIGLAMYIAERNKGLFNNKFITFSSEPELQNIVGNNIYEKTRNLSCAHWDMNTDINKVFKLIYNTAIENNLKQKDLPSMIYIISDMQFDECCNSGEKTTFEKWSNKFNKAGYNLPVVVFWNVSSYGNNNVPITINDSGAILCSGYSPSVVKYIMESDVTNTMLLVENIVNNKRYAKILA